MALVADEVPVPIVTGTAPLLKGCSNIPPGWPQPGAPWTNIVSGGMLPYGTHALLPPGGEVMLSIDASTYPAALAPNVPTGRNVLVG